MSLTQEQKEDIYWSIENEGFDYHFRDLTDEDYGDAQYRELRENYRKAAKELEDYIYVEIDEDDEE